MGRVRAAKSETRKAAFSERQTDPRRRLIYELPLTNRHIAELLILQGEKEEGYKRKAYFRAAHSAFIWPEEAAFILEQNRSLTELGGIGPSLAKTVARWIENPPDSITPPPLRQNFLTLTEARQVIDSHPDWR